MYRIQLQLKASQREVDHDMQRVIKDPGGQVCRVLRGRVLLAQLPVHECVHFVRLNMKGWGEACYEIVNGRDTDTTSSMGHRQVPFADDVPYPYYQIKDVSIV